MPTYHTGPSAGQGVGTCPWGKSGRRHGYEVGSMVMGRADVLRRPLSERYLVVFLDGLQRGHHQVVPAVGVTEGGEKRMVGLWEGVTENRELCQALAEDLAARGLSAERWLWVVIVGSKALASAVRAVWGERALIQRCMCHKARNVLEKLPRPMQPMVKRWLARSWGEADAAGAALIKG